MTLPHDHNQTLSPDDARLLDALIESGFSPEALEPLADEDRRRVDSLMDLFDLLEDYPVNDADDTLVYATMARVAREEEDAAARLVFDAARMEAEEGTRRRRIRLPDFISLAAVILIAASVIWPTTSYLRARSIDANCSNNLRRLALAFDQYSGDYRGLMPTAHAGFVSGWNREARNVLNLTPLIEGSYCDLDHLNCPGHEGKAGESYSYQWQKPGQPLIWGLRATLVLGDRNPHVDAARSRRLIPVLSMSPNHSGRGQNVLSADGITVWLDTPLVRDDNIWLPRGVDHLRTGDEPADANDVFLAH